MTTRDELRAWLMRGVAQGYTHMVVVCDTFDHDDYPVYCKTKQEAEERVTKPGDMQRIMEIYNYSMDLEEQLAATRVWNL